MIPTHAASEPTPPSNPAIAEDEPIALFVYCKSAASDDSVLRALRALGQRLAQDGWPSATLWRRPDAAAGPTRTWMAVHAPQPPARVAALEAAIGAAANGVGLQALIDGRLHVERFCPCD